VLNRLNQIELPTRVGRTNYVLDEVKIPHGKRQFSVLSGPLKKKHWGSLLRCTQQNVSFSRQYRHDMRCVLLSKFFDHLLLLTK